MRMAFSDYCFSSSSAIVNSITKLYYGMLYCMRVRVYKYQTYHSTTVFLYVCSIL